MVRTRTMLHDENYKRRRAAPGGDARGALQRHRAGTAAPDMGCLVTPVGPWLAPYQPAQRYHLIDLRRVAADDLPYRNLLRAVARLDQSRSPHVVRGCSPETGAWRDDRGSAEWALGERSEESPKPGSWRRRRIDRASRAAAGRGCRLTTGRGGR